MKIDSHQHFWVFDEAEYGWMGETMKIIKKDHLPSDLARELEKTSFQGSIAVQARQTLEETEWLLKLADENAFIKGVVGWIDLLSPDVEKQLERYARYPKLAGIRHVLHDEPDDDFMLRKDFLHGISLVGKYKLAYDILVFPKHLPNTITFVSHFPEQTFVLDHMAKPYIKDKTISPWREEMRKLSKFPNVYCKASGMVNEADWKNWKPEDFRPYLDVIYECFGADRIMIGSDWPVCRVAAGYPVVMDIVRDYIKQFSNSDQAKVLGGNAIKAYRLKITSNQ
jgi:L-fuconolactonase